MNTVSESRFLPSFLATGASVVLVCGGLLLLTSTAPWTSREEAASEARAPLAAEDAVEAAAPREITFAPPASAEGQVATDETEEPERDETSQVAEARPSEPQQATPEPVQPVVSEPSPAQAEDTVAASDVIEVDETRADAIDVAQLDETVAGASDAIAAESMSVSDAEPIADSTIETSAAPEAAPVETGAVEAHVAAEPSSTPTDQIGDVLAESAPQAIEADLVAEQPQDAAEPAPQAVIAETVTAETISEDTGGAAAKAAAATERDENPSASPKVVAAAPVPLPPPPPPSPKRKPEIAANAPAQAPQTAERPERPARAETPKQAQAKPVVTPQAPKPVQANRALTHQPPKQAQAASAVAEQATGQPASGAGVGWLPMALAPADKPIAKQPAARLSGQAYSSKVWAALARAKPRAGQNGSATVTFTIGFGGALSSVRVAKSSGNAKIDQLALATVRGAAPFPPPASGPASFTIRIDFH